MINKNFAIFSQALSYDVKGEVKGGEHDGGAAAVDVIRSGLILVRVSVSKVSVFNLRGISNILLPCYY